MLVDSIDNPFQQVLEEVRMDIAKLDIMKLKAEIAADEGEVFTAYYDSLGNPTVGKGHLITKNDIIEIGDTISKAHSERLFHGDVAAKMIACKKIYPEIETYPVPVQEALITMTYNMGEANMASFTGFNATVKSRDWAAVADFLRNNFKKWYMQVGSRAKRIEDKFRQSIRR